MNVNVFGFHLTEGIFFRKTFPFHGETRTGEEKHRRGIFFMYIHMNVNVFQGKGFHLTEGIFLDTDPFTVVLNIAEYDFDFV